MPHWFADWAVAIYDNHYWQRRPQRPIMAQVIECEFGHAQHDRAVGPLHRRRLFAWAEHRRRLAWMDADSRAWCAACWWIAERHGGAPLRKR
jgi:hypothetical protein